MEIIPRDNEFDIVENGELVGQVIKENGSLYLLIEGEKITRVRNVEEAKHYVKSYRRVQFDNIRTYERQLDGLKSDYARVEYAGTRRVIEREIDRVNNDLYSLVAKVWKWREFE